nr:MAG TPA: hypothetical protein [Caudoviricetes sp.]
MFSVILQRGNDCQYLSLIFYRQIQWIREVNLITSTTTFI